MLAVEGYQPTETQPRGFNLDHSGKYLIAAGQKSHHIAVYDIVGEQGLLQEKGRYAVGQGRCGWWSTPTEPPSGKEKPRLSEVFAQKRTGSAEKALSRRARSVATLDIVHGVANDNLQCFRITSAVTTSSVVSSA